MKKYEYKMLIGDDHQVVFNDEATLNTLGEDGWELVSVIYPVKPKDRGLGSKAVLYYLKREKREKEDK